MMNEYTVGGHNFSKYIADARRFAMKEAIRTGQRQELCCDGTLYEAYVRGTTGFASLTFAAYK